MLELGASQAKEQYLRKKKNKGMNELTIAGLLNIVLNATYCTLYVLFDSLYS